MMKIVRTKRGWQVRDDTHVLSEDNLTQEDARQRMKELVAYKRRNPTGIDAWAKRRS